MNVVLFVAAFCTENFKALAGIIVQSTIIWGFVPRLMYQAAGVYPQDWVVQDIRIEVSATCKMNWVFTEKPASIRIIVSGAIVIKRGFGVPLTPCIPEVVHKA